MSALNVSSIQSVIDEISDDIERRRRLPNPEEGICSPHMRHDAMLYFEEMLKMAVAEGEAFAVDFLLCHTPEGLTDELDRIIIEATDIATKLGEHEIEATLLEHLEECCRIVRVDVSSIRHAEPRSKKLRSSVRSESGQQAYVRLLD